MKKMNVKAVRSIVMVTSQKQTANNVICGVNNTLGNRKYIKC